jgi:uncharacterized protein involved in exopolysaccharide biosynthesis
VVSQVSEDDDFAAINMLRLWRAMKAHRTLIVVLTLVTPALAVALSYLITPTFRAQALLASPSQDHNGGGLGGLLGQYAGLASLAGIDVGRLSPQSINESVEILRSRAFTERFVTQFKLMPVLFPDPDKMKHPPTMWDAYQRFDKIRSISKDTTTGFIKLTIDWKDPQQASEWANNMVGMLNGYMRERTIVEASRSVGYLQEQLDATAVTERRQMLIRLMESETQKIMLAKAQEEYAVRVLDHAVPPEEKISPKRLLILVSGLLGGFFIGVIAALWRDWFLNIRRRNA